MGAIGDYMESLAWTSADLGSFRGAFERFSRSSPSTDDAAYSEVFLEGFIDFFGGTVPEPPRPRFSERPNRVKEAEMLALATVAKHPYTKAILLDYRAEMLPRGNAKKDAAISAANAYVSAVDAFATASDPADCWQAACDAVWRGRGLLISFGVSVDGLIDSTIRYLGRIPEHRGVRIVRLLAIALAPGITARKASAKKREALFEALWGRVNIARSDIALLADALAPWAKLAGVPDYAQKITEIMSEAALSHAATGHPLVAAGLLHEAAKRARSTSPHLLGPLTKATDLVRDAVRGAMTTYAVAHDELDLRMLDGLIACMAAAPSEGHALMMLGRQQMFLPSRSLIEEGVRAAGPSIVEQIAMVLPIGQHGAFGGSPEEMRILKVTDIFLWKVSALLHYGIYRSPRLLHLFQVDVLERFLLDAHIVGADQASVLKAGLTAWQQEDWLVSSAVLLPLVENAVVRSCAAMGEQALTVSRSESFVRRTGDAILPIVERCLGVDWQFFFRHLWAREGAVRHAYCHGYITDEQVASREPDLCVYALLSLAYNVTARQAHDQRVRETAFHLWQSRGSPEGDAWADWFEAERKLYSNADEDDTIAE